MTDLRTRLLARLIIQPDTGCLLWTGPLDRDGYGRVASRRQPLVHRAMYELFVSPIPDGLTIDHLCRVRNCGAPAHLEPVTHRVNTMRGQTPAAINAAKTHCDNNHEFDLFNTRVDTHGWRSCRACERIGQRRRYQARKAASS